jgi:tRNA A-37 threonylcarbamoyl transferase component Bud32
MDTSATRMIPALQSRAPDIQKETVRRLGALCLLLGVSKLISMPLMALSGAFPLAAIDYALGVVFVLMSFGLYYLVRTEKLSPSVLLDLGYAYAVVSAFVLGLVINRLPAPEVLSAAWSPVAVWAFIFVVVVPAQTWKTVVVAVLIVAMDPLSLLLLVASGQVAPPPVRAASFIPHLSAVILAALVSRIVHRLGVKVTEAREMGSYQLEKLLGRGGMGEVWRARHRLLARPAAVKLVRPEVLGGDALSQQTGLRRFEREAQATALMHSPHTIHLYDFGMADDGTFYYVMELLEGFDTETIVKRFGPLPSERAIYFLQQICDSLGEAHEMGLIHRDIKPGNVYVCRYGRNVDFIKVLDFGLVKSRGEAESRDVKLTADDAVSGTPGYMAPEQILGKLPLDARVDIYALGCLAYWLVTGELVFKGATVMETMVQHVRERPVPPSQRTELDIPASLERVILRCLEKDPDKRPQSSDELSQLLRACEVNAPWTHERARDWWDTHAPSGTAGQPAPEQ